jgi:hypothetical protein
MCAGVRHARQHYQHRNSSSSRSTAAGSIYDISSSSAAAALPHAASTDVLLSLPDRDSCSSSAPQPFKDTALLPEYIDTFECGSSTSAQPQQHQHCLRQRIAVVGTGGSIISSSSSGAANVAALGLVGDAAAPTGGGVAGMAFKESQQEVNLASACCMPATPIP